MKRVLKTRSQAGTDGRRRGAFGLELERLLVPIDFSAEARSCLRYGVDLARRSGAALVLLHVIEPRAYPLDLGGAPVALETIGADFRKAALKELRAWRRSETPRRMACLLEVRVGNPHREIVASARQHACQLILVSTHGYTGVKHFLMGSTAEQVVRRADCPVLVFRPRA